MRRVVAVDSRVVETPSTVTLRFRDETPAAPGQFVMVWIPGSDELPMSLSYVDGPVKGVTIKAMGSTSRQVQSIGPGTLLGFRGPYGNRFDLGVHRVLVVAGGSGAAVLAPAAESARRGGARVSVALGATTQNELLFRERFRQMGAELHLATDDGSEGHRGYVTDLVGPVLDAGEFDAVWTCGPEVMMRKVIDRSAEHRVPVYCSVERHMKCALGLCDACSLGPWHVCTDGPVFPADELTSVAEFGRLKRDSSGRLVPH